MRQQRRKTQDGVGRKKIDGVDLCQSIKPRDVQFARQHFCQDSRSRHRSQYGCGILRFQQAQHLLGDALSRQNGKPRLLRASCAQGLSIDLTFAVPGVKAEQAQDAQIILADARGGVADEAHAPRLQILDAADEIEHLAIR